ncbi:MAG: PHP domain-containing protein, partial [Anaerolineae bacterium]|nr:PHP domain-containing protein [Anaerolineae bacterium]
MQWYRVDLHVHTPASADYKDSESPYVDILRRAERRGIDIIAFTDHNTVGGYAAMMAEIERLNFLEQTGRALADELRLLAEYRRLLDKVLVLPGFEFSATFGFHVLGIFSPQTSIRYIEHVLLSLNVPPDVLDEGNPAAGSTADVLEAYRLIDEAGGIAIAAHINSAHGVMMRGLNFGGQTRIA